MVIEYAAGSPVPKEKKLARLHDDECQTRRGKECNCRDNMLALDREELKVLEEKRCEWEETTWRKPTAEEAATKPAVKSYAVLKSMAATLVRVDDGKVVERKIADPVSPDSGRTIVIEEQFPPRWVCTSCGQSMRSVTSDSVDHRCDDADLNRAQRSVSLEKTISSEARARGEYRLTVWRDGDGDYHLGEEVVVDGEVVAENHLCGPESYSVIEGAILDASVNKLIP